MQVYIYARRARLEALANEILAAVHASAEVELHVPARLAGHDADVDLFFDNTGEDEPNMTDDIEIEVD